MLASPCGVGQKPAIMLVGDPAEQQHGIALRILGDKGVPLRVLLVGPAHVAVRVREIAIQRHLVEDDQLIA